MGLAEDLGYAFPRPNPFQRSVQVVVSTRAGAWVLSKALPVTDRAVASLTAGRSSISELVAGVPIVVLTTTGRRSGLPRASQLVGIPLREALAVMGTNYGQAATPAWVLNLEADPRASIAHETTTIEVVARPATDSERTQVIARAASIYGGYAKYLSRIAGRRVRIFVLDPA